MLTHVLPLVLLAGTVGGFVVDVREGDIGGKVALMLLPQQGTGGPIVNPDGCVAHLVPANDPNHTLRYPCGKWFAPPAGKHTYWLEQENRISPKPMVMWYAGETFHGTGSVSSSPLVAGGTAIVTSSRAAGSNHARFVVSGQSGQLFERREPSPTAHPVLLPQGTAIAGFFDADGNALAVSRPFEVRASEPAKVTIAPPSDRSADLVLVLQKRGESVDVRALAGEREVLPDFVAQADYRLIAVWYGLPPGQAKLVITQAQTEVVRTITLSAGKAATVRTRLQPPGKGE